MANLSSAGSVEDLVPVRKILPPFINGQPAIAIMRDGSMRGIIKSSAINFETLDQNVQNSLLVSFGALTDSLEDDQPLQICARSIRVNASSYLDTYTSAASDPSVPPLLKDFAISHRDHFTRVISNQNLLTREFYFVIGWKGVTEPVTPSWTDEFPLAGLLRRIADRFEKRLTAHMPTDQEIKVAQERIAVRAASIQARLGDMEISSSALGERELRELLWSWFHPSRSQRQQAPEGIFDGRLFGGFSTTQPNVRGALPPSSS